MSDLLQPQQNEGAESPAQTGVTLESVALAIAEHLAGHIRLEQAATLLSRFISRNPAGVSVKSVTVLARLVYRSKNWEQAAELWNLVLAEAPENVEALAALSHCLVELNDFAAAERAMERAFDLFKASRRKLEIEIDAILEPVYRRLFFHFENSDHEKCQALSALCALPGGYGGTVCARDSASAARLSDAQIFQRIDEAFEQWHASPAYLENEPAPTAGLPEPAKTKILLVFRQYFFGGSNTREHELTVFLRESAKALGYHVFFFPATAFLLGDRVTPEQQYEALDNLLRGLMATRPHVVIFDDLCALQECAPHIGREVYCQTLVSLKNQLGFKLVAYYPDPWVKATLEAVEFVSEFADLVWHQNVALSRRSSKAHAEKLFPAPIPYLNSVFQSGADARTIGPGFLGSVYSYNYLRALWCTLIRQRQIPCQLFLASHVKGKSPAGDTIEEYGAFMSRMRIMVNFCARTPSTRIITGRAWESIAARTLLLEEVNDEIAHYFVPFVHYVPFKDVVELDTYLRFFERHAGVRQRIVDEAFTWFQRRYSKERVWRNLLEAVFTGRVPRMTLPPPPPLRF
jgi:tetratricopeptide (TPR) repeat protein